MGHVANEKILEEEEVDSAIAGKTIESEYATSITETSKSVYTYVDSTTYEIPFTNKAFLNEQAGIIARTLSDGEPCPVGYLVLSLLLLYHL